MLDLNQKEKFDEICDLIKNLNTETDDGIQISRKLRTINEKFKRSVNSENSLSEIFEVLNFKCLSEGKEFVKSFVAFLTSKQMENFQVNGKLTLRNAILSVLQRNYQNSAKLKTESLSRFYNSIELLGHLFNQLTTSSGHTINIIGQSLLQVINVELEKELRSVCHLHHDLFAKLVLSQIALNGHLLRIRHKTDLEQVLFTMRRLLIEVQTLSPKTKSFFLMSIDLVNSNFGSLGNALENMYQKFLLDDIAPENSITSGKTTKSVEDNAQKTAQVPNKNLKVQTKRSNSRESSTMLSSSNSPRSPQKKTSPNGLKTKKSPTGKPSSSTRRNIEAHETKLSPSSRDADTKQKLQVTEQNGNDENVPLRQKNSRSSNNDLAPTTTLLNKNTNKPIYFKTENVENLTWNHEREPEIEIDADSKSPKSQYTTDFLNFLSSN